MALSQSSRSDAACISDMAGSIPQKNVTTLPPFKYEPLDRALKCIRLLQVLPPDNDGIVRSQLRIYEMKDVPPYVALSYTWDRDNKFKHIECNEMSLRVGRSVWDVLSLYQTRAEDMGSSRLIWIDAVCINQNDVGERNHQVDQMRSIYSDATTVIVWLGPTVDDAGITFELARHLSIVNNLNFDDIFLEQWRSIRHFLERPYWARLWIVQEFILARDVEVWCGALSASSMEIDCLANWMLNHVFVDWDKRAKRKSKAEQQEIWEITLSLGYTLFWYRRVWWQCYTAGVTNKAFSLIRLLNTFAHSKSTDPRDKVYGLLGLAAGSSPYDFVKADYEKSVLDIAVDLVEFFCLFDDTSQRERFYSTADIAYIIRETLGLTELQFAAHILTRCSWLHTRLHLLAPNTCILVPLKHVSTITAAGCRSLLNPHWNSRWPRLKSLQLTNSRRNIESKGVCFTDSAPDLASKTRDPNLLRLLSVRSMPMLAVIDNVSVGISYESEFAREPESLGTWMKVGLANHDQWASIDNFIDRSKEEKEKVLYTDASCTSFVGTNGFYGITLDQVEPFDCSFVFAGTESTKAVLLLRPISRKSAQGARTDWEVVGTAVLFAQELVSDATWVEPLPDERTISEVTTQGNDVKDTLSRVYEGVQLKMHPYHMEEFVRCGLLESTMPC